MIQKREKRITISSLVGGLPRLPTKLEENPQEVDYNFFKTLSPFEIIDPKCLIGLEIEVENVKDTKKAVAPHFWIQKEDHSLRNNGAEFITPPLRAKYLYTALHYLYEDILPNETDFSERTSVHVHVNVRNLTSEELNTFILLYMIFERVFFSFADKKRYQNIFCVPVLETKLLNNFFQNINFTLPAIPWQKYTGLNLLPILDKGTVEFRHFPGTNDYNKIYLWVNILIALRISSRAIFNTKNLLEEVLKLNTTSEYDIFIKKVFFDHPIICKTILSIPDLHTNLSYCISKIKEFIFPENRKFHTEVVKDSNFIDNLYNQYTKIYNLKLKSSNSNKVEILQRDLRTRLNQAVPDLGRLEIGRVWDDLEETRNIPTQQNLPEQEPEF